MDKISRNNEIIDVFKNNLHKIIKIIISTPINKDEIYNKIVLENKTSNENDKIFLQGSFYFDNKVKHENYKSQKEFFEVLESGLITRYKNTDIICTDRDIKILTNKKGKFKIIFSKPINRLENKKNLEHNRKKNYLIEEGTPVPWLIRLGVMTKDGNIIKDKSKKFRQINKFLEIIEDYSDYIPENAFILDFGCGKSYLTFSLYYYLNYIKNKNVSITGLDLKKDVVEYCDNLAGEFNFANLNFELGNIKDFNYNKKIDMVVTLHACDTATDYAIFNAIKWNSSVILTVPCCQHELNSQIKNEFLKPVLKYGILKERFSALLTDGLRAELMELCGYKTQVMEFIDIEDTPKNLLIRGVKRKTKKSDISSIKNILKEYNLEPTLYKLLKENGFIDI